MPVCISTLRLAQLLMVSVLRIAMVKAIVLLTFGKLSYYMSKDNPYNQVVINLLLDLSKYSHFIHLVY
jgi:hypothetical protein